jgi:hypothetical protein
MHSVLIPAVGVHHVDGSIAIAEVAHERDLLAVHRVLPPARGDGLTLGRAPLLNAS